MFKLNPLKGNSLLKDSHLSSSDRRAPGLRRYHPCCHVIGLRGTFQSRCEPGISNDMSRDDGYGAANDYGAREGRPLCHQISLFVTSSVPICIRSTQKSRTSMPLFAEDLASVVLESEPSR